MITIAAIVLVFVFFLLLLHRRNSSFFFLFSILLNQLFFSLLPSTYSYVWWLVRRYIFVFVSSLQFSLLFNLISTMNSSNWNWFRIAGQVRNGKQNNHKIPFINNSGYWNRTATTKLSREWKMKNEKQKKKLIGSWYHIKYVRRIARVFE